jgi:uncharacterized protein YbjT (DUF2867 family)
MRIAVVGATGRIGGYVVEQLTARGHETVPICRAAGVDAYAAVGLDEALAGVDVVVDVSNTRAKAESEIVDFFGTTTRNLLAGEERAGVRQHVVLSIVGIDRGQRVGHYAGKREQERLIEAGPIPWTIVRSTQFHDFAAMVAGWRLRDNVATIPPLLVQPIDQREVGEMLADVATAPARWRRVDIAGPEPQDLVDMARRTFAARGQHVRLIPTWQGIYDTSMAGEVLLPGDGARLGKVTFDDWLAAGAK